MNFCKGGAFGEVFFARHAEKNYEVAIKFVSTYSYILFMAIKFYYINLKNIERCFKRGNKSAV